MASSLNALLKSKKIEVGLDINESASLTNINNAITSLSQKIKPMKIGVEIDTTIGELKAQIGKVQEQVTNSKSIKPIKIGIEIDKLNMKEINNAINEMQNSFGSKKGSKSLMVDLEVDVKGAGKKLQADLKVLYDEIKKFNSELSKATQFKNSSDSSKFLKAQEKAIKDVIIQEERLQKLRKESFQNDKNSASLANAKKYLEEAKAKATNAKSTEELENATKDLNRAYQAMSDIRKNNIDVKDAIKTAKLAESARQYIQELKKMGSITDDEAREIYTSLDEMSNKGSGAVMELTESLRTQLSNAKRTMKEFRESYTDLTNIANKKGLMDGMINAVGSDDIKGLANYIGRLKEAEVQSINLTQKQNALGDTIDVLSGSLRRGDGSLENFNIELNETQREVVQTKKSLSMAQGEFEGFFGKLRQAFTQIPAWGLVVQGMEMVKTKARETVTQIFEVNKAMTEIRKVASDGINTDALLEGTIQQSITLGSNLNEMLDSLGEVARTYDDLNEKQLMTVNSTATIMANVSDLTVPESMESLIGTMNAFKLETEDAIGIVDRLNEVNENCLVA